ncbi:hypothetical protein [Bacillus sp. AR18-7]|uniref:hypothetical protein n=1 Tax=Bacillus sp. AR18-7 TaxID=2217821 RepID=UPI0011C820B6|nr:hypothetical protein [Bacillus sp. AR18-7]TXR64558.1 hypothetical protein DN395_11525 [Bacillus sp. AR18-7]
MNLITMIPLFILMFVLTYLIVDMILERKNEQKYKIHNFLEQYKKEQETRTFIYVFLQPILQMRKSWLPKKREEKLREKLAKANSKLTPIEFVLNNIVLAIFVSGFSLIYIFIFPQWKEIIMGISLVAGILAYIRGNLKVNKAIKARKLQVQLELPEYMIPLGYMLGKYTTYQATLLSLEYASENLKPHVEELITQMELNPGSYEPYLEFAQKIDEPVAYQFMIALQQAMKLDPIKSKKVIANQINLMRNLRAESYRQLNRMRPSMVSKYIYMCLITMMFLPLGLAFVSIMEKFAKLF